MSGKYSALEHYLQSLPDRQQGVVLTFQELESILNTKLPHSAYTYLKWWTFESHPRSPQKQAYIRAGWRLCAVSLSQQWIQFIRQERLESRPLRDGSIPLRSELPSARSFGEG
ncbi:MAG: hypothetical protein ACM3QS_13590 [Bacteroidota bacterium]